MSSVTTPTTTPLTFAEKEERKMRKKARQEEERFKKSGDEEHLRKRDQWNDQAKEVKKNSETDKERKKKKKVTNDQKSDDQLLNEAIRQNRREKNDAYLEKKNQKKKEDEKKGKHIGLKQKMKEKAKNIEEMKKEYQEMVEKEKGEGQTAKVEFSKGYLEKHPEASESEVQKEFVRHRDSQQKAENLKVFFVRNMADMTGKELDELLSDYEKTNTEFREKNSGLLERELVDKFEEECKAVLTETNCRMKFVEEVIKMTGEKKEQVEKEYDEDYKKFTEYANDNGYTRKVAVDKYVDLSNKKLQVAQFRYTIVSNMMKENGMSVDEATHEFDKMMNVMNKGGECGEECDEPMCIKCD